MIMRIRAALVLRQARRRPRLDVHGTSALPLRVWPSDTDVLGHMNNGAYLSVMDLGRYDLIVRSGVWDTLRAQGIYQVVASETISFRKSLLPRQRYLLSTRIVGYDPISVYVEQRFSVDREIFAVGIVRGRMLRRSGGAVAVAEISELLGIDVSSHQPPDWVTSWAENAALPSSRTPHVTEW